MSLAEARALEVSLPDADLQAGAGRLRPRRGDPALGRRGQGVPRLPDRDLGLLARPLPPGRRRGGPGADRAADARLQSLLHRADGAAGRAPRRVEPRRPRLLRQLGHRGERVRDQDRPQARPRPRRSPRRRSSASRATSTAARYGALSATPRPARNEALGPMLPGFRAVPRNDAAALREAVGAHRRGPDRADPGRVRRPPDLRRGAAGGAPGLRRDRRPLDPRRDSDRDREDRLALGLRADPGPARRPHHRQGARRRDADRRLRRRPGHGRRARARRPRLDLRRRTGRDRGGADGARHGRRPGPAAAGARARNTAARRPRRARGGRRNARPRPHGRRRPRRGRRCAGAGDGPAAARPRRQRAGALDPAAAAAASGRVLSGRESCWTDRRIASRVVA